MLSYVIKMRLIEQLMYAYIMFYGTMISNYIFCVSGVIYQVRFINRKF